MAKKAEKRKLKYANAREVIEKRESGFESSSVKLPDGIDFFSFKKEGTYRIDVLPYEVGKGNPVADPGVLHYERTYFIHRGIGPESKSYCCLAKNWGKACPICEHCTKMKKSGDDPKEFLPKERQLWVIIDKKDEDKKIQLLDQSHFLFGKQIDEAIKGADDGDNYENFFHLEGGMTLKITVVEENFLGHPFRKPARIEFKPREDYEESILESIPCLDDLLNELSYKELKKIFEMTGGEKEEEDSDDDSEEEDDIPPKKSVAKKTPAKKPDPDEDEDEDDSDDSDDEDSELEEAPKKKPAAKKPATKKPPVDDDDDEEEDSELEDSSDLEDDDSDDEDSEVETPKKKPGRPRK